VVSFCYPICGDGKIIANKEACDDGNINDNDGCSSTCTVEPNYNCSGINADGSSNCIPIWFKNLKLYKAILFWNNHYLWKVHNLIIL